MPTQSSSPGGCYSQGHGSKGIWHLVHGSGQRVSLAHCCTRARLARALGSKVHSVVQVHISRQGTQHVGGSGHLSEASGFRLQVSGVRLIDLSQSIHQCIKYMCVQLRMHGVVQQFL
jgi:hypothetical protein